MKFESDKEEKESSRPMVVVIDFGKCLCKAGFAGESAPSTIFPSVVGRPMLPNLMVGPMKPKEHYVGEEAMRMRGVLLLKWWFDYGMRIVTNFDDVEKIWHHIFYNECRITPHDAAVIVTRPPLHPRGNCEKMVQIMFETFQVRELHVAIDAVLALFSSGRTTGVVVDCGDFRTNVVPIFYGQVLAHAVELGGIGGDQVTDYLVNLLTRSGYSSRPFTRNIDIDIKERLGYVALDFEAEVQSARAESETSIGAVKDDAKVLRSTGTQNDLSGCVELIVTDISGNLVWEGAVNRTQQIFTLLDELGEDIAGCCKQLIFGDVLANRSYPFGLYTNVGEKAEATFVMNKVISREYELPDGNRMSLGRQRFQCAELFFQPAIDAHCHQTDGIHQMIDMSIARCDDVMQPRLYSNILLAGGSACFPGMKERLIRELNSLAPSSCTVCVTSGPNPALSTWIGGSILGTLSIFKDMCISMEDYMEIGPEIVHEHGALHGEDLENFCSQVEEMYAKQGSCNH